MDSSDGSYSAAVPSLPWRFSTRTVDVDLASAQGGETYYPLRMQVLDRKPKFLMSIDAMQIGPVLLGDCRFDADIKMEFAELHRFYHFNIPLSGHLDSRNLGNDVTATPQHAVLYGPRGDVQLNRWSAGSRILCVKIGRAALEVELERLLQRPINRPIDLAPSLDLTHGYGRILRDLACLLAAAAHSHRDELLTPGLPCRPATVKRVIEAMHAAPETPFSAADLADVAGVSIRTLQAAFRSHVDMPPMAYLRNLRLERVHAELRASDPLRAEVAAVAHRWGFTHLGRFALAYRKKYGEHPSTTLRF